MCEGASKQLGTIIEGESLLNDGAAIVLFNVFLVEMQPGESQSGELILTAHNPCLGLHHRPSNTSALLHFHFVILHPPVINLATELHTLSLSHKHTCTALEIFLYFVKVALGGPAFGYLMAKITIFWLSHVFNDALVEITITLASTYITFYIGEGLFEVSGVLAVVTLGIELNSRRTSISPEVEAFLHRSHTHTVLVGKSPQS